jgi:hypothetical protein
MKYILLVSCLLSLVLLNGAHARRGVLTSSSAKASASSSASTNSGRWNLVPTCISGLKCYSRSWVVLNTPATTKGIHLLTFLYICPSHRRDPLLLSPTSSFKLPPFNKYIYVYIFIQNAATSPHLLADSPALNRRGLVNAMPVG